MDEYPIIDLSHLLPAAQGLARLPADERIQRLRADRWIGYPRAVEALNRLEALYAWPNKQRMPNLLLVGPTNNGKSMIVEKFRRTHPASSDADQEHIPVLVVQMPSEPSVIRFYVALLAAMGAPLRPRPRLPEMEQLALANVRSIRATSQAGVPLADIHAAASCISRTTSSISPEQATRTFGGSSLSIRSPGAV
ncbi:AAA family ATPase [Pseudomonas aeruginosa]|uniref:TniB family NTP-binding protein n=1 Tax=Pseudomonas aeruginosa TaxID=287 RepID=UPI0002F31514|nr:hypothetical protein DZ927_033140 [Pseudomonas aeruginosa]TQF83470.1 AAA family ATPase [Pseudomonas aeruginosa]TQF94553.1 AAA family ATPase [Pseudomonas aeruginosa]TQG03270.1 AAA family ATPase [Pseudomonas aeruginosa]TQG28550.1 AAA family ATPase [Pseudomonas aeruginosa]